MCECDQSIELTKDAVRRVLISYTEYSECVLMCVCVFMWISVFVSVQDSAVLQSD